MKDSKTNGDEEEKHYEISTKLSSHTFNINSTEIIQKYFPRYPTTGDGFCKSFNITEYQKIKQYLHYYGVVVVKVLNKTECDKTIDAMGDEIYLRSMQLRNQKRNKIKINKLDIHNPLTWKTSNFPGNKKNSKFLTDRPAFSKQSFMNRCSKKMYNLWKHIYDENELNVSIGNYGIQRGTKHLPEPLNEQIQWRNHLKPHWDINPWTYKQKYANIYQGALALSEQRICDGTHITLPGMSRTFLDIWCERNKSLQSEKRNLYRHSIDKDDPIVKFMQCIPLRKGEMVIWNYGQLHGNTDNYSDRMRVTQYIKMYPAKEKYIEREKWSAQQIIKRYKLNIKKILADEMNELNLKLLSLKSW